jgi:hypothetical protein
MKNLNLDGFARPTSRRQASLGATFATVASLLLSPYLASGEDQMDDQEKGPPPFATVRDGRIDREAITQWEAVWALFIRVQANEENGGPQDPKTFLQSAVGLDEADAESLLNYIRETMSEDRGEGARMIEEACIELNPQSSRERVADVFTEQERFLALRRQKSISNMAQVLSPSGHLKVMNWVDSYLRPNMKITSFNYGKAFEGRNVASIVEHTCLSRARLTYSGGRK